MKIIRMYIAYYVNDYSFPMSISFFSLFYDDKIN